MQGGQSRLERGVCRRLPLSKKTQAGVVSNAPNFSFASQQIDWLLFVKLVSNGMEKKLHRRRSSLGYHSSENRRFLRWQMYCVLSSSPHTVLARPALVRNRPVFSHSRRARRPPSTITKTKALTNQKS
jgi:hypothetical protein